MKKKKAFIGAIVSAVGSVVNGVIQHQQQKAAEKRQAILQNRADTYAQAQSINEAIANDNISLDNKIKYGDRQSVLRCGGRRKRKK